MRALAAPARLKGVLPATEAAAALAEGFRSAGADAVQAPVADGGEGTADLLFVALGGEWRRATVSDPLGRPVEARWLVLPDGTAVVEAAEAIGLGRVAPEERDPLRASSRGLGELLHAAIDDGADALLVCLGGAATVDGGRGLLALFGGFPAAGHGRLRRAQSAARPARRRARVRAAEGRRRRRRSRSSSGGWRRGATSRPTRCSPARARPGGSGRPSRRSAPSSSRARSSCSS